MVDESDKFEPTLKSDPTLDSGASDESFESVGNYRMRQKVGEGGMGEVWEAEQLRPIRRQVALKIIKKGMDTKEVIARFETERQALALMDHRCIARVFDAGSTPRGRPFFAMEYVKGVPLTEYCDKNHLQTKARLNLFIEICEGVQHAHQKGIIHRDLKPSNVLVAIEEEKSIPKIIDFGLAKATSQSLTENTLYTELGQLMGTPEYMSPEQAEMSGLDVDTRTDVYSLGALLYELLVGALPFNSKQLRQSGFDELRRQILEVEPPRPSTRISRKGEGDSKLRAANRATDPRHLSKQLRGDLDWICMKAMEKDRTRRYASATDLAADVTRYLKNEPVLAGPPSAVYRTKKFIRRHRVGVAVAGVVGVAVLLGIAGTTVGMLRAIRAERKASLEAETARQVSDFMVGLFEVADPNEARGNSVTAREILDEGSVHIREDLRDQPIMQARLMHTMGKVYRNLGLYDEAGDLLEDALDIKRDTLGANHVDVAHNLTELGDLYSDQAKYAEAEPILEQGLAMIEEQLGPEDPAVAQGMIYLADVYFRQGKFDEAEELYLRALEIRENALGRDHPDVARAKNALAIHYGRQDRYDEAERLYKEALAIWEASLGKNHLEVARGLNNLGILYAGQQEFEKAIPNYERALEIYETTLGPEHARFARCLNNIGYAHQRLGHYQQAEGYLRQALTIKEKVHGLDHPSVAYSVKNLAVLYKDQGNYALAEPMYRRALSIREESLGANHPDVGWILGDLGIMYRTKGDFASAEPLFERALAIFEAADDGSGVAWTLSDLAVLYREQRDYPKSERYFQRAITAFETALGSNSVGLADCLDEYVVLLRAMDRSVEADAVQGRAAAIRGSRRG